MRVARQFQAEPELRFGTRYFPPVIRFGVAGWDYKDWWGPVYPISPPQGFDPLAYLARYFDTIEINSTFYGAGSARTSVNWARRVHEHPQFRFTAKLWKRFTHDREEAWNSDDVSQVRATLEPLAQEGRLGCVVAQFPWSFKRTPENEEWMDDLLRAFSGFPLAVEVRHSSWNESTFYTALSEQGVGVVNIDQPLFRNSMKPGTTVTAPIGYVRLHGRNFENWFREEAQSHERYDYLYSAEELTGWLPRIHEIASRARETFVIANNHYLGKAPANAAMLRRLSGANEAVVPPDLEREYHNVLAPLGIRSLADGARRSG
jgi:uncharacterized protein YecE (DUF72 family)